MKRAHTLSLIGVLVCGTGAAAGVFGVSGAAAVPPEPRRFKVARNFWCCRSNPDGFKLDPLLVLSGLSALGFRGASVLSSDCPEVTAAGLELASSAAGLEASMAAATTGVVVCSAGLEIVSSVMGSQVI